MLNPIKEIVRFNQQAGLLETPYKDNLETAYQIEEAIEGFNLQQLCDLLNYPMPPEKPAKHIARHIVNSCVVELSDLDRLDKACDAVIFAIGSMAKLRLNAQEIAQALNIVMRANFTKLENKQTDAQGKLLKPNNFVGPEEELQKLLNKRSNNILTKEL